jgi:hypothetical protein
MTITKEVSMGENAEQRGQLRKVFNGTNILVLSRLLTR